jgi:hypothetical protein
MAIEKELKNALVDSALDAVTHVLDTASDVTVLLEDVIERNERYVVQLTVREDRLNAYDAEVEFDKDSNMTGIYMPHRLF